MDSSSGASERSEGTLGKEVQVSIGSQLRKQYQKIVEEGVPDRFLDLLQRYDQKIQERSSATPAGHDDTEGKDPQS